MPAVRAPNLNAQHGSLSEPGTGSSIPDQHSGACAAHVMDTIPLVMRYIRSNVQSETGDLPSIAQIRVLSCLTNNPGSSLSEVARYLSVTKATASTMIGRMVDRGLVERFEDPKERRCVILHATILGKETYLTAKQNAQKAVEKILEKLTAEQRTKVLEAMVLLGEAFAY